MWNLWHGCHKKSESCPMFFASKANKFERMAICFLSLPATAFYPHLINYIM